jgi:hypothetical protein
MHVYSEASRTEAKACVLYVRLEEDGPVVEEFRRLLRPAAGHAFSGGFL